MQSIESMCALHFIRTLWSTDLCNAYNPIREAAHTYAKRLIRYNIMSTLLIGDSQISTRATQHHNLSTATLIEAAIARGEGALSKNGALVVKTGKHTGRSAKDKYIVRAFCCSKSRFYGCLGAKRNTLCG
jgi:hypothetical protein